MSAEKETLRRVQDGLFHLRKGLTPFVEARLKAVHGANWAHYASRAIGSKPTDALDAYGLLKTLLDRSLIRIVGKKEEPGRPILYGTTKEFLEFFETRAVPAQRAHGMTILGPLVDLENPNKFVFLRGFPSLDERDRMKEAFYEGELWKNELESVAMPMLDSYDVILCETSGGCVLDLARAEP